MDSTSFSLEKARVALPDADLVILACPVPAIIEWIVKLPQFIQHPCIVIEQDQDNIRHIYLRDAKKIRPDISNQGRAKDVKGEKIW